jgi:PAS domain S-box-containing protein
MSSETGDNTMAIDGTELFEKLLALVELAHDSIIVRDIENRITFWNRGAEEKYGWKREEALGKLAHSLLQSQFSQALEEVEEMLRRNYYWEG